MMTMLTVLLWLIAAITALLLAGVLSMAVALRMSDRRMDARRAEFDPFWEKADGPVPNGLPSPRQPYRATRPA